MSKRSEVRTSIGQPCPICQYPMTSYKRNYKVLIEVCHVCRINKYVWEDGSEEIYEGTLKKSPLAKSLRVEGSILTIPGSCPAKKRFAMGLRCGEFVCKNKGSCKKMGLCSPMWVYYYKDSQGYTTACLLDDIIAGVMPIQAFISLAFSF